ncbi:MAG: universal stress protein [Leptospiraceae bacterium]|nr:universal stress protein [Leptospiraceae bacterium]MCP5498771.1 universal stress protein [Leptospiraceae bacterium]
MTIEQKENSQKQQLSVLLPVQSLYKAVNCLDTLKSMFGKQLELIFLHVVDIRLKDNFQLLDYGKEEELFQTLKNKAEIAIRNLIPEESSSQVMVVEGIPFLEIVKIARDLNVDLIVMKRNTDSNEKKIENLLFGSTTERVIRASSIPVISLP